MGTFGFRDLSGFDGRVFLEPSQQYLKHGHFGFLNILSQAGSWLFFPPAAELLPAVMDCLIIKSDVGLIRS